MPVWLSVRHLLSVEDKLPHRPITVLGGSSTSSGSVRQAPAGTWQCDGGMRGKARGPPFVNVILAAAGTPTERRHRRPPRALLTRSEFCLSSRCSELFRRRLGGPDGDSSAYQHPRQRAPTGDPVDVEHGREDADTQDNASESRRFTRKAT